MLALAIGAIASVIIAWFAIALTGLCPRDPFDYVVGVGRWAQHVHADAFLLTTHRYPPFALR